MTWYDEVMRRLMKDRKVGDRLTIDDVYELESDMKLIYPNNQHIPETLRDLMQDFRDTGWLKFEDFEGTYVITDDPTNGSEAKPS